MITRAPDFCPGYDYRELSPEEGKHRWRYVTRTRRVVRLDLPLKGCFGFYDKSGRLFARLLDNLWIIEPGYAWNGASPKRHVPLLGWIGTPDPENTHLATLVHDSLGQAASARHFPLSRRQVDACFYDLLVLCGSPLAGTYHAGVRIFGPAYAAMARGDGSTSRRIDTGTEV